MPAPVVGTSFYLGIPASTRRSAYECVEMAADVGIRHFFTSVQMPEADIPSSLPEFRRIGRLVNERGLRVMADAHPVAFRLVGGSVRDLSPFREIGVTDIRLDAGFSFEDTAALLESAAQLDMTIVINASPQTEAILDALQEKGVPLKGAVACHNYYPRAESGLSADYVAKQADLLHQRGMAVMGFVASMRHHRFMTYEGLPTLERHRYMEPHRAARELLVRNWCDQVYIGDQTEDPRELQELARIAESPHLILRVKAAADVSEAAMRIAFGRVHQHLPQAFEKLVRARGDRQRPELEVIAPPARPQPRKRGAVAVDNVLYPRFAGELQIALTDLAPDPRTSVVGHVISEDMPFLDALGPRVFFELEPSVGEPVSQSLAVDVDGDDGAW